MSTLDLLADLRETAAWFPHSYACRQIAAACDQADIAAARDAVQLALALPTVARTQKLRACLEAWITKADSLEVR